MSNETTKPPTRPIKNPPDSNAQKSNTQKNKTPKSKPPENKLPESRWSKLKEPTTIISIIVTVLLAVFGFYYNMQRDVWKEKEIVLQKEVDKVKQELVEDKSKTIQPSTGTVPVGAMGQITIMKSQTASIPDLSLTLDDLVFKADPSQFTVNAKVTYKDLPPMQIRKAEAGYKVEYPPNGGYTIEIIKVGAVSATFAIMKSSN
jgi:hypothetical protein